VQNFDIEYAPRLDIIECPTLPGSIIIRVDIGVARIQMAPRQCPPARARTRRRAGSDLNDFAGAAGGSEAVALGEYSLPGPVSEYRKKRHQSLQLCISDQLTDGLDELLHWQQASLGKTCFEHDGMNWDEWQFS
jgi:hypothetical protein